MPEHLLYLGLNLFAIAYPLAQSFEWRLQFYKKWKALFPAILVMAFVFIPWDIYFTHLRIWGFNPRFLTDVKIANLPMEEWLFFCTIPFACVFIYEVFNFFVVRDVLGKIARPLAIVLAIFLAIVGFWYLDQTYTSVTFLLTAALLLFVALVLKPQWLGRFFLAYAVSLIPFFFVNGVLTGSWLEGQVVWYNSDEILRLRMGTIPVEDSVYNLLMLLLTVTVYEWRLKRNWANWPAEIAQRKAARK